MSTSLTLESLDTLFPFSLIIDGTWRIKEVGRSLKKILPALREGQSVFEVLQLYPASDEVPSPAAIPDELLVFTHSNFAALRLRGQAVRLTTPKDYFLLSLDPTLFETQQIRDLGLELGDFRIGDPVFDLALFTQSQKRARQGLEVVKKKLEWEGLAWRTILDITRYIQNTETLLDTYRIVIQCVCTFLDWDVARLFMIDEQQNHLLRCRGAWAFRNESQFEAFLQGSTMMEAQPSVAPTEFATDQPDVVWMQHILKEPGFCKRHNLPAQFPLIGVAVPIRVDGVVIAVLEFFGERPSTYRDSTIQFFRLLNTQLHQVVVLQESARREKMQLAALTHSAKLAAVGEIAAGVAHEINNPLHTLSLISEVLKRFGSSAVFSPEVMKQQYGKIDTCIKHMSRIVRQLGDFSRDASSDNYAVVPLASVVQQTLDLCQARIAHHNIRLDIPNIPDTVLVRCHPSELAQVLLNLINNAYDAIEHLDEKWIAIDVVIQQNAVEISISDSGRGLSEDVAKKVMTPFFTTKPPGKGTGLGLSISRNIITGLGGDLLLDTSCPHTRFVIRLPQASSGAPKLDIAV